MSFSHLSAAIKILQHPEIAAKETEAATRKAANAARKEIRAAAPRAKSGARLPPGRKPGMLRGAVGMKWQGRGFDSQVTIKAGGLGPVIIGGNPAREIRPSDATTRVQARLGIRHAKAISLGANGPAYAHIQHPAIAPVPYIELGEAASEAAVQAIMDETGQRIVAEMAAHINRGGP